MTNQSKTKNWTMGIVIFGILSLFIYVAPVWGRGPALFGVSLASASFFLFYLNKKQGIKSKLAVFALIIGIIAFSGNAMTVYTGQNPNIIIDSIEYLENPPPYILSEYRLADEDFVNAIVTESKNFDSLYEEQSTYFGNPYCNGQRGFLRLLTPVIVYEYNQTTYHIFRLYCIDDSTYDLYFNVQIYQNALNK